MAVEKGLSTVVSLSFFSKKRFPRTPELLKGKADSDIKKRVNKLEDVLTNKYRKHIMSLRYTGGNNVHIAALTEVSVHMYLIGTV